MSEMTQAGLDSPRRGAASPIFRMALTLLGGLVSLGGCGGSNAVSQKAPKHVSQAMVEGETYMVVSQKKDEVLVRRCASAQGRDGCEVTWLVGGRPKDSFPATSVRSGSTTAARDTMAEPVLKKINAMRGEVLNIRGRAIRKGSLYGVEGGSYVFEISNGTLEIVYRMDSDSQQGTRVASLRVEEPVYLNSFITHDRYGLFALQVNHGSDGSRYRGEGESEGPTSTSWIIFEQSDPGPSGKVWTIPSVTGQQATIVSAIPSVVALEQASPASPSVEIPDPVATPVTQIVDVEEPLGIVCEQAQDCEAGELCQTPEARSWNHCGAPVQANCPEGFMGDSCGHCFEQCKTDDECSGKRCNGSYCESQARCAAVRPPPM